MRGAGLVMVIMALGAAGVALARQTWLKQPEYQEVNPGEIAMLTCIIANKEGECRWEREGRPIGMFRDKYEWAGDRGQGDCSLLVRDADTEWDDGNWQCSVSPSKFKARDALVSNVTRLVVRTAPEAVVMRQVDSVSSLLDITDTNDTIDVLENTNVTLECRSQGGKPPPKLLWQLPESVPSFSLSERVSNGSAISVISALVMRSDSGKLVKCKATHSALVQPLEKSLRINVLYVPVVSVEYKYPNSLMSSNFRSGGAGNVSLSEGESVMVRCRTDSNPPASVAWRRAGVAGVWSTREEVLIEAVGRDEAGIYTCTAHNRLGVSGPREIVLNVEYSPHIVSLSPSGSVSGQVGSRVSLTCEAEANPPPAYQWVQKLSDQYVIRGNSRVLILDNIIFEDDGEYMCHATNVIRNIEKITHSAPVHLTVTGPPRLYLDPETRFETSAGSDTSMEVRVCGEPRPLVQWKVDHLVLAAGSGHGRYKAHSLHKLASHPNCYISRLSVLAADREDSKTFQITVENVLGAETHSLELRVHESSQIEVLIAIAVGGVLTILTICLIIIYVLVSRDSWTWCWCLRVKSPQHRQGSDISELGSDKTDIESPDSSIITSSAANNIFYHDIRPAENSFHTFNRQKKNSMIPCGAYSVTQGSISSLSPHRGHERSSYRGMSTITRVSGAQGMQGPPGDLSGVSYYRYN